MRRALFLTDSRRITHTATHLWTLIRRMPLKGLPPRTIMGIIKRSTQIKWIGSKGTSTVVWVDQQSWINTGMVLLYRNSTPRLWLTTSIETLMQRRSQESKSWIISQILGKKEFNCSSMRQRTGSSMADHSTKTGSRPQKRIITSVKAHWAKRGEFDQAFSLAKTEVNLSLALWATRGTLLGWNCHRTTTSQIS